MDSLCVIPLLINEEKMKLTRQKILSEFCIQAPNKWRKFRNVPKNIFHTTQTIPLKKSIS